MDGIITLDQSTWGRPIIYRQMMKIYVTFFTFNYFLTTSLNRLEHELNIKNINIF